MLCPGNPLSVVVLALAMSACASAFDEGDDGASTVAPDAAIAADAPPQNDVIDARSTVDAFETSSDAAECSSDADCNDGRFCNGVEVCTATGCAAGVWPTCDDGVACTDQVCDWSADGGAGACVYSSNSVCSDANQCNGVETCNPTSPQADANGCVPGTPVSCDDGDSCTTDTCITISGACLHTTPAEVCDGSDNDCDAVADNGFACVQNTTQACTTSCGSAGTKTCNSSCTGWSACAGSCPSAPSNDTCVGAASLSGAGTVSGTLVGAARDVTDASSTCGIGVEVFYEVSVNRKSFVYMDTFGSSVNTRISYRGSTCPGSNVACQDDACGTNAAQLVMQLPSAGTYYFAVHTYAFATTPGPFTLSYQVVDAGGALNVPLTGPGNYSGGTAGGSDFHDASCSIATGPESSYYWTQCPGESRTISANTCVEVGGSASFDSVLHLRGPSGDLACNDDYAGCSAAGSLMLGTADGAGLYQLLVDGYAGGAGNYTLDVTAF